MTARKATTTMRMTENGPGDAIQSVRENAGQFHMRQDPVHPSSAPRRPRWVVPLVTLIGIALTAAAANWQLDRADQKEGLQRAYDRGASDAAIRLAEVSVRVEDLRLRKVEAVGEFMPRGMVLLDNKIHNGQAGYEVIMP